MKRIYFVLAAVLGALGWAGAQTPAAPSLLRQTLRTGRGQHRYLLVGAPTAGQPAFKRQQELLATVPAQLRERDIEVLNVLYVQLNAADRAFSQRMGLRPGAFGVVLIGKDGGVKRTSTRPLQPADLFSTVDQMPMRRQEMRQRGR